MCQHFFKFLWGIPYRGFGFSKFVSIGNKADVNELDLLRYYHKDPNTDVIMIYMEEHSGGRY
jgi:acyl-CoA synthetase (NDP forming)